MKERNELEMLNRWRTVEYTDDGCTEYECLKCHTSWEARTSPEHAHWRFCPVCGTQWLGVLDLNFERAEHGWKRRVGGATERQRALAKLCQATWQVYVRNTFTEGWETDGEPFKGTARLALSFVERWKRPCQDRYRNEYQIKLVNSTERFPLP